MFLYENIKILLTSPYIIPKNPNILGEKIKSVEIININQKNILVFLPEFFFSIILYDQYINPPVKSTKSGLNFVKFAK